MINIKIEHRGTGQQNLDYDHTANSSLFIHDSGDYFEYDGGQPRSIIYTSYIKDDISPYITMYGDFTPSPGGFYETNDDEELNIVIHVDYDGYTPPIVPPGGDGTGGDDTPMVVTFNYYVDDIPIDDDTLNVLNNSISHPVGQPVEETWPRTLECYHIRFDKINPIEEKNPGTTSNTSYNSLEFTYIDVQKYDENELVDNWPYTGSLNTYKLIHAFPYRYFAEEKCVTINGIEYKVKKGEDGGEDFTQTPPPIFHSVNTKTLEVNLYYNSVIAYTKVHSYKVDPKYLDSDLWGYVSTRMNSIPGNNFTTYEHEIKYAIPLTSGNSIYCRAIAKPGFEFVKWVSTSKVNSIHGDTENYKTETARRNAVLALPAVESSDDSLPNTEIKISAYSSNDITAVFKGVKNEVKLYKGLDFSGTDNYNILGGNSDVDITIPTRKGAKLLGWVEYNQEDDDPDTKDYPSITKGQYKTLIDLFYTVEEAFNIICLTDERINKGVIRIDNPEDKTATPVLLPGVSGYTDSYGNWLTGDKTLYPLWLLEEYNIKYVSDGEDSLIVYEEGIEYEFNPIDYGLPTTYTIADDFTGDKSFKKLEKLEDKPFPQYRSFDKWDPSEIKPFTKTDDQTITAYWILDTYKITLEKNNGFANQTVKIKSGESTFVNGEKIHNPTERPDKDAYDEFVGWYTENNEHAKNGTGKLLIGTDDKLQPNVSGYTDSDRKWIKHENTTVYAKWTPNKYTITYRVKDNNGNESTKTENYTIEYTKPNGYKLLRLSAPEGHYLDGWYTDESYSSSKISMLENGSYGNKTFYGRYKPSEFAIRYNNIEPGLCSNYEDLPVKHTYGVATELIKPEMALYTFVDWYTDKEFTNKVTGFSANYIPTFIPIDLYAKRADNPMLIVYKDTDDNVLEDSTLFNSEPPVQHVYGKKTQLVGLHKNGYAFDGWYDNIECSGESFMELGPEDYLTHIALYFKFTPIKYTIKYYIDGVETNNTGNPSKYTKEDLPITLKNPSDKLGYHSIGWRRNSSSSTTVLDTITDIDNWNLYWVWEPNTVTITWNANGGTVTRPTDQYTYDGEPITPPTPTRTGYDFDGWYTSSTGGTKITDVGVNNKPSSNVIYYAHWGKQSYTLTWNPNGGTIPSSPAYTSGNIEFGASITKPNNPTKNYYVFTNWKDQDGNTNVASTMPAKNLTYTAQYEGKTITITWNPNCNELATTTTTYKYGEHVTPQNLIRTGYIFLGWSTTQDGTNIQNVFGGTTVTADSITYYACWEEGYSDIVLEQIDNTLDNTLEQISDKKVATFKWINNIFGEPEKTVWNVGQANFFIQSVDLQKYSPLSGHCVKYNDTWVGSGDSDDDKCPIQNTVVDLYKSASNKHFYLDINSIEGNKISFTSSLEGVETNDTLPNYPGTDGFIVYFSINDSSIIYKTTISHTTKSTITIPNTNNIEKINIHRIPCYATLYEDYIDYFYPLLYITNSVSNLSIIDNTPMKKIIIQ